MFSFKIAGQSELYSISDVDFFFSTWFSGKGENNLRE